MQIGRVDVVNLTQLVDLMGEHLRQFEQQEDHRAAFLRVYRHMTSTVIDRLSHPFFLDAPWVERVAIRFAWYYFDALDRFEQQTGPPPAWERAFSVAVRKQAFLLQDILLGMNAHINNDLPLVVAELLRSEEDEQSVFRTVRRRFDHDQINRVLHEVIPSVEVDLARSYGRLILPLGRVMGNLDQTLAAFGLKTWRDNVWRNARFLLAARTEPEQRTVIHFIQQDALRIATEIERFPLLRWCRPLAPLMRRWRLG